MIPKTIHYIWLGGKPLPPIAEKCIASWQKFCPDFEIKRWDETNLDLDKYKFARQAYDAKKYAYASDVLRFDIINTYGGLYLDIDVELLKPLDEKFFSHKAFFAFELKDSLNPGLIFGAEKNNEAIKDLLNIYENLPFLDEKGNPILKTICIISTDYFVSKGLKTDNSYQEIDGIAFYPTEYFCPYDVITGKTKKTKNTYAIHHYLASWYSPWQKFKSKTKKVLNALSFGVFGKIVERNKQK